VAQAYPQAPALFKALPCCNSCTESGKGTFESQRLDRMG